MSLCRLHRLRGSAHIGATAGRHVVGCNAGHTRGRGSARWLSASGELLLLRRLMRDWGCAPWLLHLRDRGALARWDAVRGVRNRWRGRAPRLTLHLVLVLRQHTHLALRRRHGNRGPRGLLQGPSLASDRRRRSPSRNDQACATAGAAAARLGYEARAAGARWRGPGDGAGGSWGRLCRARRCGCCGRSPSRSGGSGNSYRTGVVRCAC
mmetsp:Transcript_85451/g.190899  ORF Transcript_85451/g.190899 Transcript_85451/m.190899 type:complete len:209 (-) Transcript_85451:1543-2169(-)